MSLRHWPLLGGEHTFNAPENYKAVDDPLFTQAVVFTLKYTAITTVVLSLVAFATGAARAGGAARRGLLPHRLLPAGGGRAGGRSLIFYALTTRPRAAERHPARDRLVRPINWIGTPNNALFSTVVMITWRFAGFYMLIMLTGLQAIPRDVYEAARVDGASWWHILRSITLPLLRPTLALMLILSVTGSMLAFDQFYILTNGGPDNRTATS